MNICFQDLLVDFGKSSKPYTTREKHTRFLPSESLYVFKRTICACVAGPTRGHEWAVEEANFKFETTFKHILFS
jgi:hypothetical protein